MSPVPDFEPKGELPMLVEFNGGPTFSVINLSECLIILQALLMASQLCLCNKIWIMNLKMDSPDSVSHMARVRGGLRKTVALSAPNECSDPPPAAEE